jgi:hypothetical protein
VATGVYDVCPPNLDGTAIPGHAKGPICRHNTPDRWSTWDAPCAKPVSTEPSAARAALATTDPTARWGRQEPALA